MRLTKDIRNNIHRMALANVPVTDYLALLIPVVQGVLRDRMPPEVRAVYDNEDIRSYLNTAQVSLKDGNSYTYLKARNAAGYLANWETYGATHIVHGVVSIRVDAASLAHLKEGTLGYALSDAVIKSGFYHKHVEQQALLASVEQRLSATLNSVGTTQRLYDVLEPELHHLIPKEGDKTANLPATAAPVADDLRKLGAELPTVPKAK